MSAFPSAQRPLWIATRAGYSLRVCAGRFAAQLWPLDVSSLDRGPIVALAPTPADDMIDALLAGDEDLHAVLDPVAALVNTYAEDRFEAVASVEPGSWDGLLQIATVVEVSVAVASGISFDAGRAAGRTAELRGVGSS